MTNETAQQEGQPGEEPQPDRQDPLQAFGSIFRQQLDQAIEPIMENIRLQNEGAAQNPADMTAASQADTLRDQSAPHVLSPAADGPQAQGMLQTGFDAVFEDLFSDNLQQVFRDRSEHVVQSLVEAGRELASKGTAFNVKAKQFTEALDEFVQKSFSDSVRDIARRDGERVIGALISRDGPAAREAGTEFLTHLTEQRFAAAERFWQHVLTTLLEAGHTGARPSNGKVSDAEPSSSGPEHELPQTLLRSDKRAQGIWVKARDKATAKGGPGAERAAYAALKQRYEKKGDRWVKKASDRAATGEPAAPARKARSKTK